MGRGVGRKLCFLLTLSCPSFTSWGWGASTKAWKDLPNSIYYLGIRANSVSEDFFVILERLYLICVLMFLWPLESEFRKVSKRERLVVTER